MKTEALPVEIAVVIVTRNMRAGLQTTIESLGRLGDDRVRVYVVDGSSTDGTVDYLRRSAASNLHWLSETDTGIYDAMNKGWKMVPADAYVIYLGSGDRINSLPSSNTLSLARQDSIDIVIGTCMIGDQTFTSSWHSGIFVGNTAHHQALLIRKSVHPDPPFDTSFRVYGDWDFNVRLFSKGLRARFDKEFQSYAKPGGASATHNLAEVWRVSKRHGGTSMGIRAYALNLKVKTKAKTRGLRFWRK